MRHHELREGIEVVDEQGVVVGTSAIAAKRVRGSTLRMLTLFLAASMTFMRYRPFPIERVGAFDDLYHNIYYHDICLCLFFQGRDRDCNH